MGPIGVPEMIVIFLLALVLFGPKKLPELGRTVARGLQEFRKAQSEFKATLQHHMSELERENESVREITRSFNNDVYNSWYDSYKYDSHSYGSDPYNNPQPALESSTAGASAISGAEAEASHAGVQGSEESTAAVTGTVPRSAESLAAQNGKAHPAPVSDAVNG